MGQGGGVRGRKNSWGMQTEKESLAKHTKVAKKSRDCMEETCHYAIQLELRYALIPAIARATSRVSAGALRTAAVFRTPACVFLPASSGNWSGFGRANVDLVCDWIKQITGNDTEERHEAACVQTPRPSRSRSDVGCQDRSQKASGVSAGV